MLKQSHIEQLIHDMCPNGVEYKELGELCVILDSKRKPVSKGLRSKGVYPYYGANGILDYVDDYIFDGTYLLLGEDGSVINEDKSPVLHWVEGKVWVNNHAHVLAEYEDAAKLRYLYYVLQTIDVSDIVRGTPPKINQQNLRGIKVPLPPIKVQEEVVRLLDVFQSLIYNIDTEINAREKQLGIAMHCYLDLDIRDLIQYPLIEVADISRGVRVTKQDLNTNGKYAVYQNSLIPLGYYERFNTDGGTPFVISAGSAGMVGYSKESYWAADDCLRIECKDVLDKKFAYYYLLKKQESFTSKVRKAGVPRLSRTVVEQFPIPVPPIAEQRAIAEKLDTIEAFIANLKEERALRQQQYEYYRAKLISLLQ